MSSPKVASAAAAGLALLTLGPRRIVTLARQRRWSTKVGLEDGCLLLGGEMAQGNAALVSAAVRLFRDR